MDSNNEDTPKLIIEELCGYTYWDIGATRLHYWWPNETWAIGNGPIEYISEERAMEIIEEYNDQAKDI